MTGWIMIQGFKSISNYFYQYRFEILLITLIVFLVLPSTLDSPKLQSILRTILLLVGLNVMQKMQRAFLIIALLAFSAAVSDWLSGDDSAGTSKLIAFIFMMVFFITITYELFSQIVKSKEIKLNIIIAAFNGYLLVGLIFSFLYTLIEAFHPGSIKGLSPGVQGLPDILYFSYITQLTIGYGDILPVAQLAKKITILQGLVGQFYLVVIMAILVGKFLIQKDRS
ncbi:MAG: ion channel [Bacteroidetes bacterium]|nr:ion channel [Bacteroidota bacterium]